MRTVIYIDLYFVFNFAVDVLCLYLCGLLCSKRTSPLRLCIASAFGALYACASLFLASGIINTVLALSVSFLMFFISFKEKRVISNILGAIVFFSVSALFCGAYVYVISVFSYSNKKDFPDLVAYIISAFVSVLLVRYISSRPVSSPLVAEIHFLGSAVRVEAIVDSANFLTEPISAKGVAVLSLDACGKLLKDDITIFTSSTAYEEISENVSGRIRYVNIKTATGSRVTPCLRADKIAVFKGKKAESFDLYFTASDVIEGTSAQCLLPSKINLKI